MSQTENKEEFKMVKIEMDGRDAYIREWMEQIRDVLTTRHNSQQKLKLYAENLQAELPLLLQLSSRET
jgi:hypothetical protein